jgi:hypothetical protein
MHHLKGRSRRLVALGGISLAAGLGVIFLPGSDHSAAAASQITASERVGAASVVQSVLPGATATLTLAPAAQPISLPAGSGVTIQADSSAQQLAIDVTGSNFTPLGSTLAAFTPATASPGSESLDSAAAELAWHAEIAAAYAGTQNPDLVRYAVTVEGAALTQAEAATLQPSAVRSVSGGPEFGGGLRIGSVPYSTLTGQLQSNLKTLKDVLPAGAILQAETLAIPLDASLNDYAFEVDLRVADLGALKDHAGDILLGLGTGLTGGPDAPSEGLAINLIDNEGRRAGWWSAIRAAAGAGWSDPAFPINNVEETTTFPNLTGGPAPTASSSGGGGSKSQSGTGYALAPTRGIGPVSISERKASVERALGRHTPVCHRHCLRAYDSKRGDLLVAYQGDRVGAVQSKSGQITLGGLPLKLGPRKLARQLHRWKKQAGCTGSSFTYGAGPSTSLSFGKRGRVEVTVSASSVGGCGGH